MIEEVLRMERVAYQEQGAVQLENFDLNVFAGEIMGLVPVDSHGLTAFINLLLHNHPLDYGYIYYREKQINSWRTPRLQHNRICVIQNKSSLVDALTVADNIFVLRPGNHMWLIRPGMLRRQLQPFLDQIGVDISADAYVEGLSAFQRCVVELVKAVVTGSKLVILRELNTVISESELAMLHTILKYYAACGVAFLYISFHLEEVNQICARTAMMENGRITKVLREREAQLHVADRFAQRVREQWGGSDGNPQQSRTVFEAAGLSGGAVRALSFSVSAGECVVLQDLHNRIFSDFVKMLLGDTAIGQGEIRLCGERLKPGLSREIAVIQEQPVHSMLFPELSCLDNLCFTIDHRFPELWRNTRVQSGLKKALSDVLPEEQFDCRIETLGKYEKYNLVYHRIMLQNPKVVFCIQPFKGADMRLRMHIWGLLESMIKKQIAVVILAVNLADSLSLANRLIRIGQGTPNEVYEQSEFGEIPFSAPWIGMYRERG